MKEIKTAGELGFKNIFDAFSLKQTITPAGDLFGGKRVIARVDKLGAPTKYFEMESPDDIQSIRNDDGTTFLSLGT